MLDKLKAPSALMQGLIALLLLANFTFMLVGPTFFASYEAPGDALTQTLVNLVILAVGYYLGSSSNSARKDEQSAAQTDKAITALASSSPTGTGTGAPGNGSPTDKPDDPVTGTGVKP